MRNVKYGLFTDFMPPTIDDDDTGLIGAHIYIRNAQRRAAKTLRNEYYVLHDGSTICIHDATFVEKALARLKFVFAKNKRKVVGVRGKYNPYDGPVPRLGVCYGPNGQLEVDSEYFNECASSALSRGDRDAYLSLHKKKQEAEEFVSSINHKK